VRVFDCLFLETKVECGTARMFTITTTVVDEWALLATARRYVRLRNLIQERVCVSFIDYGAAGDFDDTIRKYNDEK
jgi:hypothetical protein